MKFNAYETALRVKRREITLKDVPEKRRGIVRAALQDTRGMVKLARAQSAVRKFTGQAEITRRVHAD